MSATLSETARGPVQPDAPRVLCVDDEPYILEGLRDTLRRSFDVYTAESGPEALTRLERTPNAYALIIADMRMPVMSGSAFLSQARRIAPDAVRMLLTGHADLESAIKAVNDGQVFRFLTKPCPREELLRACAAALSHHRLVVAERVLLEQTLRGSIKALVDVLALTNPAAFGRAVRLKAGVRSLAERIGMPDAWEVEIAAMLVDLGAVTLPDATAARLYEGTTLSDEERRLVDAVPQATERIIGHIPRMEGVAQIVADIGLRFRDDNRSPSLGGRMLRVVADYDELDSEGLEVDAITAAMRAREGVYDPELLQAYTTCNLQLGSNGKLLEISLAELKPGTVLAEDIRDRSGGLLIARGYRVTQALIDRLSHVAPGDIREPLRVVEPVAADAS